MHARNRKTKNKESHKRTNESEFSFVCGTDIQLVKNKTKCCTIRVHKATNTLHILVRIRKKFYYVTQRFQNYRIVADLYFKLQNKDLFYIAKSHTCDLKKSSQ